VLVRSYSATRYNSDLGGLAVGTSSLAKKSVFKEALAHSPTSIPQSTIPLPHPLYLASSSSRIPLFFFHVHAHNPLLALFLNLMILPSPAALLFSLVLGMSASAAPVVLSNIHLVGREVWAPPITSPQAGTVWSSGSNVTVTWYVDGVASLGL
jgi:hypothetical protein